MSTRSQALSRAAELIVHSTVNLASLCQQLDGGGCGKLAEAIRAQLRSPPPISGKPDKSIWTRGTIR